MSMSTSTTLQFDLKYCACQTKKDAIDLAKGFSCFGGVGDPTTRRFAFVNSGPASPAFQ